MYFILCPFFVTALWITGHTHLFMLDPLVEFIFILHHIQLLPHFLQLVLKLIHLESAGRQQSLGYCINMCIRSCLAVATCLTSAPSTAPASTPSWKSTTDK